MPSKADVELHYNLDSNLDFEIYPHIKRWWNHMRSFSDSEKALFPIINPSDVILKGILCKKKNLDMQVSVFVIILCSLDQ